MIIQPDASTHESANEPGRSVRPVSTTRLAIALATLAAAVALLVGCTSADAQDDGPVFALDREAAAEIVPIDPDRADVLPAALVRSLLQDLLTEHSDLSVEVMRQAVDGDVQAASLTELTRNTDDLTVTIGVVYGPEGAAAFDQLWTNHIEFFNDYAAARGAEDETAAAAAIESLNHYENDFSSYIDTATSGEADFHAVLHVLHSHVTQLLQQADAWSDREFARAAAVSTEAHEHMDVIANALAIGIGRQQPHVFTGDPTQEAAVACAARQLDATLLLSAEGMRQEAQRMAVADAVRAADVEIDALRAGMDTEVLDVVDRFVGEDETELATPPGRAALRDVIRAELATGDCAGFIVG